MTNIAYHPDLGTVLTCDTKGCHARTTLGHTDPQTPLADLAPRRRWHARWRDTRDCDSPDRPTPDGRILMNSELHASQAADWPPSPATHTAPAAANPPTRGAAIDASTVAAACAPEPHTRPGRAGRWPTSPGSWESVISRSIPGAGRTASTDATRDASSGWSHAWTTARSMVNILVCTVPLTRQGVW